jgi:uncharacterized protein
LLRWLSGTVAALLWFSTAGAAPLVNAMKGHPSPYLAMHGGDPVAWQEWSPETVKRARREGKLLYVSVGYFSCHWCHVMQRESYSNPGIAKVLNDHFIPVKVDRELASGLDAALQGFSERTRGIAGWPLNAFVTPEGYPLIVVLYAPPDEFVEIVRSLAGRWQRESARLRNLAEAGAAPPVRAAAPLPLSGVRLEPLPGKLADQALEHADTLRGGLEGVSKFPSTPLLSALLTVHEHRRIEPLGEFLALTLRQMARLGLRDHVNGGFFRYTVDPDWQQPHFEKMLYDNAQLARLYLRAGAVLGIPEFSSIAFETIDFMLAALWDDREGAFAASLSAVDEQGREGAGYLWDRVWLKEHLSGTDFDLVARAWGLNRAPDFDLGHLPMERTPLTAEERGRLKTIYGRLRELRPAHMPRDSKLLAGMNGLALTALSEAGRGRSEYLASAQKLYRFLTRRVILDGALRKGQAQGVSLGQAELEDYAYVIEGLSAYTQASGGVSREQCLPRQAGGATGRESPPAADSGRPHACNGQTGGRHEAQDWARRLARVAWRDFYRDRLWLRDARPLLAGQSGEVMLSDGSLPSPSAILIRFSQHSGDPALSALARDSLARALQIVERDPLDYPGAVMALAGY